MKKGNLSIDSENIFPIIKKWLYSDHDIFYREVVSNGCDAITKLKKLAMAGEATLPEDYKAKIVVSVSSEKKTIEITDNGLGMTAEEVEKYINQIAFSGATDFMSKYKDKANEDQIIGHFGLGFYSVFMVSDHVSIDTLSYQKGAKAVHWESDNGMSFEMKDGDKEETGTKITLKLSEDSYEFCNEYRAREVLQKYCSFMPTEIYLVNADQKPEEPKEGEEKNAEEPKPINTIAPLFTKHPNECKDEDYKEFYRSTFHDYKDPVFWIHLNMDYPFNLKGILYFPQINFGYDSLEGTIKLYNNQVFVADNIKEVIPEYMMLLKGVIDCPDLPLNVSRSALQNDGFVKKIQDYISKKIADKLSGFCKVDREFYEKNWDAISPFVKFGCLKDEKFCQKMTDYILFKNLEGKYEVLPECLEVKPIDLSEDEENIEEKKEEAEKVEGTVETEGEPEKKEKTVYYVTDAEAQGQYVSMFKKAKMDAVLLPNDIDIPFIQQLEMKNEGIHFKRIDTAMEDSLRQKTSKKAAEELKANTEKLQELFKKILKNAKVTVQAEKLKNKEISSMLVVSEESLRMQEMMKQYGMTNMGDQEIEKTLLLNVNHKLVSSLLSGDAAEHEKEICEELYDLARLQQGPLKAEDMAKFVHRTNEMLSML